MKIVYIKNMVCHRCVLVLDQILTSLQFPNYSTELGKVIFEEVPSSEDLENLGKELKKVGFELLTAKEDAIIERVKTSLIKKVNDLSNTMDLNLSDFLQKETSMNYQSLSKLFSSIEGKTIERYFITLKVEKVKELIKYDKLNISEISYELGYSSPQHLAKQFKQITGMTTSEFKKNGIRTKLDNI